MEGLTENQKEHASIASKRSRWQRPRNVLLVLIAFVAIWLGYAELRFHFIVEKVQAKGGSVRIFRDQPEWFTKYARKFGLSERLEKFGSRATSLDLSHTSINDEELSEFLQLPRIRSLDVSYTQVTEASIDALSQLSELRTIRLCGCKITDRGAKVLLKNPNLFHLGLAETLVSDDLVPIARKNLSLSDFIISGDNVKALQVKSFQIGPPQNGSTYVVGEIVMVEGSFEYHDVQNRLLATIATSGNRTRQYRSTYNTGNDKFTTKGATYTFKTKIEVSDPSNCASHVDLTLGVKTSSQVIYELGHARIVIIQSK